MIMICSNIIHANLYLQIVAEIGIGTFTLLELLPSLQDVFAAIGSASVIYDIIDVVSV